MSLDKISNDVRVYTDLQSLEQLRGQLRSDPDKVKHEVSQQFEALFMQMVLKSMRDANQAMSSDMLSSSSMSMYQDMFDKQLSLSLSQKGIGLAKAIEENISRTQGQSIDKEKPMETIPANTKYMGAKVIEKSSLAPAHFLVENKPLAKPADEDKNFSTPKSFVRSMWDHAKQAASIIGTHPTVLLAQSALETSWGRKIISHVDNGSSHNLFNIKSGSSWNKESASVTTLENKNGVMVKEKASFRRYDSYLESFMDYAKMITENPRYKDAVKNAANPDHYARALQNAGYASDQNYASKIMKIHNSPEFKSFLTGLI